MLRVNWHLLQLNKLPSDDGVPFASAAPFPSSGWWNLILDCRTTLRLCHFGAAWYVHYQGLSITMVGPQVRSGFPTKTISVWGWFGVWTPMKQDLCCTSYATRNACRSETGWVGMAYHHPPAQHETSSESAHRDLHLARGGFT